MGATEGSDWCWVQDSLYPWPTLRLPGVGRDSPRFALQIQVDSWQWGHPCLPGPQSVRWYLEGTAEDHKLQLLHGLIWCLIWWPTFSYLSLTTGPVDRRELGISEWRRILERSCNKIYQNLTDINLKSYSPQIGMIEREEVDIGVTSFFATIKRQEIVDFSPIIDYAE